MRMLVVGAGATGGYFGGRLAQAGRDVTFLVRPSRAAQLRANGLRIISPHGDVVLTPKLVTADQIFGSFDAVLLTVKAFALDAALKDVAPAIGPETMVLPVLNGMKHVNALIGRFGEKAVVGCVCKVAASINGDGRIVQLSDLHEVIYGEMDGSVSTRIGSLDAFMRDAGFNARLSPAIKQEMWEKWLLLATLGGVTCLMRGNIGEIEAAPGGVDFLLKFLDEVAAVVRAAGVAAREDYIAQTKKLLTAKGSLMTSSMYRDLHSGNDIEADQIIGDLLARGQQAGVPTPLLATTFVNLMVYQNRKTAH